MSLIFYNKRFKTDSQRVAFSPCVDFGDLGGMRQHRIALLTTETALTLF